VALPLGGAALLWWLGWFVFGGLRVRRNRRSAERGECLACGHAGVRWSAACDSPRPDYDRGVSADASANLEALLGTIRAELPTLRRMGVRRIGVFGSRARESGRTDSDVDVLVEFEAHRDLVDLIEVKQHLEAVLGLPVDVTTPSGLRESDRSTILRDLRYAA
jgi:hypothetical protein